MNAITDLCFLCTKENNCVGVDDKIICEVKYTLPEVINITFGIPLRICFVCNEALYAFSKFKQISVDNILRLEGRIKGAPGPLHHTDDPHIAGSGETSHIKPEEIEEIIIKEEPLEPTTRGPQLHTNRASPDPTPQLQTRGAPNIQQHTHTQQLHNVEEMFIKEEPLDETQDQVFDNNIYQSILKEEYNDNTNSLPEHNTENKMETLDTSEDISEESFSDSEEDIAVETEGNCSKTFECRICNKTYEYKSYLERHMKHHTGKKEFQCEICNKSFLHKSNLIIHTKTHSGIKDFHCDLCWKSFTQKYYLDAHRKIHSEIKDFKCDSCSKSFTQNRDLVRHMRTHIGIKDFKCKICNKLYLHKSSLVAHMKIHSGVKDFHCDVCNKSFIYKFHLESHMRSHSAVKDFLCETCNQFFKDKSELVEHKKLHLEIKDHICAPCNKSFSSNLALVNHMKFH